MANKLIPGTNYLESFQDGQGLGSTNYFSYDLDLDANFVSIRTSMNALVDEVRGVQGPNQILPLDILTLDDPGGIGITSDILIGSASYQPSFVSVTRVDVSFGTSMVLGVRVAATSGVQLSPVAGTDDGGTDYAYIALDANGAVTINGAPGQQVYDIWRVEVDGTPEFVDNIQRVDGWEYGIDGDNWVELTDSTGLGGVTFTAEKSSDPAVRAGRVERLLSGFVTDLQSPAATIGPMVVPGGSAATPGLILGDGTGTAEVGTGVFRIGANRYGIATSGNLAVEIDAAGQVDLPLNFRVKGRRTAALTIADGGALTDVDYTAADVFDIGTWHDPGGGTPEEFTVPTDGAGTYLITAAIQWAEAITNIRDITVEIQLGGTLIPGGFSSARLEIGEDHASTIHVVAVLAAANVIRVQVSQDDTVAALGLDVIDATLSIVKVA
jgi:hypothetical protein